MKNSAIYEDLGVRGVQGDLGLPGALFNTMLARKSGKIQDGNIDERDYLNRVIFVEHPHVYTLGKSGSENNMLLDYIQLQAKDASFFKTDRGGDITYHGPGQIVGYPIFDLELFGLKLKEYIYKLEESVIITLKEFGLSAERLDGATGVWLDKDIEGSTRKICAIGVRASRYVTMHGFAFNVNTNLEYFNYINPCGFTDKGVTSLEKELGAKQDYGFVKEALKRNIESVFELDWITG